MNLQERIARRRTARSRVGVIVDRDALSPTIHRSEPVGRGSVLERLLDAVEPVFSGRLPEPFAVVGPAGSGSSAVVTALFDALTEHQTSSSQAIGTTTRAGSGETLTWFIHVDARRVQSAFAFYRAVLTNISPEPVPTSGVRTDELRERLSEQLERHDRRAIVAIDHHDEPETITYDQVCELLEPVDASTTAVAVGQHPPPDWRGHCVEVPQYRQHELVDILTERASAGLAPGALEHQSIRNVAEWADGNAHDALTVLFTAAIIATAENTNHISDAALERAKADVPHDSIHVDRVLALPETRQRVLLELVALESTNRPIREVATAIASNSSLTVGTVKRFLYELADRGVITRIPLESDGSGRQPSMVEPRFPPIAFRALTPKCGGTV